MYGKTRFTRKAGVTQGTVADYFNRLCVLQKQKALTMSLASEEM